MDLSPILMQVLEMFTSEVSTMVSGVCFMLAILAFITIPKDEDTKAKFMLIVIGFGLISGGSTIARILLPEQPPASAPVALSELWALLGWVLWAWAGVAVAGLASWAGRLVYHRQWPTGLRPVWRIGKVQKELNLEAMESLDHEALARELDLDVWFVDRKPRIGGQWERLAAGLRDQNTAASRAEDLRSEWEQERQRQLPKKKERPGTPKKKSEPQEVYQRKLFK